MSSSTRPRPYACTEAPGERSPCPIRYPPARRPRSTSPLGAAGPSPRLSIVGDGSPALDRIGLTVTGELGVSSRIISHPESGKTTLLNLILCPLALQPTRGRIEVGGAPVRGPGPDAGGHYQAGRGVPLDLDRLPGRIVYSLAHRPTGRPADRGDGLSAISRWSACRISARSGRAGCSASVALKKRVDLARAYAANPEVLLTGRALRRARHHDQGAARRKTLLEALVRRRRAPSSSSRMTWRRRCILGNRVILMSPRPGAHRRRIPTGSCRRTVDMTIRTSPQFIALRGRESAAPCKPSTEKAGP